MPRRPIDDDDREPDDEPEEEDAIYPGDPDDWQDFIDLQMDRDDDFGEFLEGLDHLDDIFDYPNDDDWYSET